MKRVLFLLTMAIFGMAIGAYAQQKIDLPSNCSAFLPKALDKALIKITDAGTVAKGGYGQSPKPKSPKYWVVYSDRKDNITYSKPDGQTPFKKLDFNEKVRIAKIENGYALVYNEPVATVAYPEISADAQREGARGWVPMSKLLLWPSCPTDKFGIYQKALICANFDQLSRNLLGQLFKNPEKMNEALNLDATLDFYYVMKTEGNMVLLARYHSLEGRSDQVLYGWVDKQSYVAWNQRSCLEKTWDRNDVKSFVENDVRIDFYKDSKCKSVATTDYFELKEEQTNSRNYNKYLYRTDGNILRWPILDGSTSKLYHVTSFTSMHGGNMAVSEQMAKEAEIRKKVDNIQEKKTNINIGVVIDGTRSMEEFYPAVIEAIQQCKGAFDDRYKILVGAVIYRDYTDGAVGAAEVFPLTRYDSKELHNWLAKGGEYGIKSAASDRTYEEALYHGINTAVDKLKFKIEETNILLVVGDCGNNPNDTRYNADNIAKKIADKGIHLMGFQVRHSIQHQAYSRFRDNMQRLIMESLKKKYNKYSEVSTTVRMRPSEDGYESFNNHNSKLFIGAFSCPQTTEKLALNKLTSLLTKSLHHCYGSTQTIINDLEVAKTHRFNKSSLPNAIPKINESYIMDLMHSGGVSQSDFDMLDSSNALIAFSGYAYRQQLERNVFKPVAFMSAEELANLLNLLNPINASVAHDNPSDRTPYIDAVAKLASLLVGDDPGAAMSMGINEIMRRIMGLNEATSALSGRTLDEIANPQVVDDNEYLGLLNDFRKKYQTLSNIKSRYEFKMRMNGLEYYWIPMEDLP